MGGTFDPIHVGHLILAEAAYTQLGLTSVAFLPAGQPPHKRNRPGRASNEQREEMVRLAIDGNGHFTMDSLEMQEDRPSYTYLTLERLRSLHPDTSYVFLMGEDSLRDFSGWRRPDLIAAQCELGVFARGTGPRQELLSLAEEVAERFSTKVHCLEGSPLEISSSYLREQRAMGGSLRYYVPEKVYAYIEEQGLYLSQDGKE